MLQYVMAINLYEMGTILNDYGRAYRIKKIEGKRITLVSVACWDWSAGFKPLDYGPDDAVIDDIHPIFSRERLIACSKHGLYAGDT